jgi:hypothetical protein
MQIRLISQLIFTQRVLATDVVLEGRSGSEGKSRG